MPRSVYYYWANVAKKADPYQNVKNLISDIFHSHQGRYGYRRVQLELGHRNHYLNHKTVQRLMSTLKLKSTVRPKRYQSYRGAVGQAAPNLLERNFSALLPNQK